MTPPPEAAAALAPRLALILPSGTYRAADFVAAAARAGAEVLVVSDFRQAMGETMADRSLQVDLCDSEAAAAAITVAAGRRPLRAVVAVDDQGIEAAALACQRLGLAHNPPVAVRATRDKIQLRRRLAEAGVEQPLFAVLEADGDASGLPAGLGWPVVIKPRGLSGSRGVIRVDDAAGLRVARARIARILVDAGRSAGEALLVERFVPGPEIAVEALLTRGKLDVLAVFDKPDPLDGPYFEETLYVTPSRHSPGALSQAVGVLGRGLEALGLVEGPVHAELRLSPDGPVLLEVAARSIGGLCSRALRFGTGTTLEDLIVRHALGEGPASRSPGPAGAAAGVMMLPIPAAGRLAGVEGLERARAVPLIEGVEMAIPPGGEVVPLPEGDRYLGFAFARGGDPEAVEAALRAAHAQLRFDIRPAPVSMPA